MLRLAQFCLMAQIVLAPLLLGGARPWAMAILSIMSGLGILAVCIARKQVSIPRYLVRIWGVAAVILIWSLLQSLPIWPIQAYPFNAPQIALYPNAWMALAANLIWLTATVTLSSLLAQGQAQTLLNMGIKVLIASCALQVGLAMLASVMDWQTTFWFGKSAHLDDWTGSFANRNAFGAFLGFGILGCLYLFAQDKTQGTGQKLDKSGGLLAFAVIFAVALLQSHSRSALALTLISTLIFLTVNTPQATVKAIGKRLLFATFGIIALIALVDITNPELTARFIELAGEINQSMPHRVVERLARALDERLGKGLSGARVLVMGVAYKKNVDDMRESPALKLIELIEARGAVVDFHDPFVPRVPRTRDYPGLQGREGVAWKSGLASGYDATLIVTDHDGVDYAGLVSDAPLVVDTRNACRKHGVESEKVVLA